MKPKLSSMVVGRPYRASPSLRHRARPRPAPSAPASRSSLAVNKVRHRPASSQQARKLPPPSACRRSSPSPPSTAAASAIFSMAVFDTLKFPEARKRKKEAPTEGQRAVPEAPSPHPRRVRPAPRPPSPIIGPSPNVGKSTAAQMPLTNPPRAPHRLAHRPAPRARDCPFDRGGRAQRRASNRFVDTAGNSTQKGKTHMMAEKLSVIMARPSFSKPPTSPLLHHRRH